MGELFHHLTYFIFLDINKMRHSDSKNLCHFKLAKASVLILNQLIILRKVRKHNLSFMLVKNHIFSLFL